MSPFKIPLLCVCVYIRTGIPPVALAGWGKSKEKLLSIEVFLCKLLFLLHILTDISSIDCKKV